MTINLAISKNSIQNNVSETLIYQSWKEYKKNTGGYCLISNTLEEYLPFITDGSLNLYLFYLIHADNNTGNSFYSVDSISKKLRVSTKTITNWNSKLSDLGLISRQKGKKSSNTYLLPTSNFTIFSISENLNIAIKELNYKKEKDIILSQKARNGIYLFYKYKILSKIYTNNKSGETITRYIYIGKKIETKIRIIDDPKKEIEWNTISDTDIFVYTGKEEIRYDINNPNNKILENITSLLDQILYNFDDIKSNYPKLNIVEN